MAVQINVAANQAALVASIQAGVQAYNQRFANNNQINLNINSRAFSQPLGRITGDVKDFEAALAASNARVIAFGASTAVLGGVIRSFKELATVTIDVEKNLADINRVFGLTTSQLQKFSTDLFNVSKQTASSFDEASKAALEFSRQGLKAEDTLQRTKDALTLTRLAGISTANAVDALTSTVNGFAATGISTTQILNKLVAVEQDYAVGAGDLAEALSRTGQAAQEAGVSLDQLNALVTAAQQSTARGGAVIGNALKTIFTRLQRTETLDQLEAFNIAVRDVQGNILPAVTILQNFAGAYKNLADAQKAQLSEQVAGVYQVNILKAVVNDLNNAQGVYAGALQRGASATNEAEIATAKLNRTLDALLSQTATSAQQLANNIGKVTFEPLARYGTEQLKSLVESMNEILEGEGVGSTFANGLLKGIRNILAGPGAIAAFFTLFKLIQNSFTYLSQALPQIAGITTETQNRKNIEQSILQIMQQQGPLSQALAGTMGNQAAQAQLLLQLARQQTAEYQQQSALAKQLAVQLSGQGVKVAGARGLQVTRAGGYVPPATRMAEVVGAQAGGYSPGKVVSSPVGGVMNTAEDIKYIPGFAQPFINPPANSKAGRAHRQNAINRTGVDPYVATGFIPNFAATKQFIDDKGEAITGKKPNKTRDSYIVRLTNYNPKDLKADEDLDLKRELVDSGYWNDNVRDPKTGKILHYNGERNNIYDTLSGNLKVVKYLNKDEVDKATKIAWDGLISGNTTWMKDPNIINLGMNQSSVEAAFDRTKGKLGLTLEDFRFKKLASENSSVAASNITREKPYKSLKTKEVYKTPKQFEKSLNGDFNNFIGDFYEQLVLKHEYISGRYKISAGNTDPADLVPEILGQTMYKGIEAKNTAARINDLIAKAVRTNVAKMNQNTWDKSNDVDFGTFPIYQTKGVTISHNGFIPNFSPLIDDNARNKHDFPGGVPILPIPDKALQNIVDRQKKRQMTYLDFDRTLVRTMGDIAYSRVSPDQKKGVLQKMFLNKEARLNDIKSSKLTQFGELLRKKIQEGAINPSLLGLLTASDETPGMPEYISSIWGIPKRNQIYSAKPGTKEAKLASLGVSASGFIPNFAIPVDSARIPWFKKYASSYKNTASDKDVFRQIDFPTYGKGLDHSYAKIGNPDMISFLYEDFVRSAMNIALGSKQIVRSKEAGFKHTPTNDISNRDPIDLAKKLAGAKFRMLEVKQSKNNQKETISQISDAKLRGLFEENPQLAKNVELMSIIFNDPRYVDPTGKNPAGVLSPFEQSIAPIVKNSYADVDPVIKSKLSKITDGLLRRYQAKKNLFSKGFIPNFASRREMFRDLIKFNLDSAPNNQNVLGGKTNLFRGVRNNKNSIFGQSRNYSQTENSRDYFRNTDIDKIANDHILEKKLLPFVSASTDKDIAEHFARGRRDDNLLGSGAVGSKTIKNSRIFSEQSIRKFIDKYGEKALKDLMLELSNWGSFGSGKGMAINFQSFSQKKGFEGTDFAKEISFLSNGFIPNFGNLDVGARSMLINSGTIPFVVDLERRRIAESSAADDMFHSQIVNKKFIDPKTKKPIYPKLYKDDIHSAFWKDTFVRGFVDSSTAKVHFDLTTPQKEDKNFMQKYSVLLEQVRNKYAKKFEEAINKAKQTPSINPKNPPPSQKLRNQLGPYPVNHFNNGFIPNFNFIKGRNSFQKNWLIETAKKRNLNLNDPNVFHQLATEFAKTYPNDQGMFGLSKGFIPNFANKSIADHRSIRAIYDLFIGGKKINEKNGTLDELLKIADPNNKQFKQLKTKGTPWTVQDIKGLPISEGIYANGFIPNFAYKQAVMGLEESMSGNKAIFDTKPFPHIRNSSQPTFSSAIADHGGLNNALSDSMRGQKAAGLMSRGFVPNFARNKGPRVGALTLESNDPSILHSGSPLLPSGMRNSLIRSVNDLIKQYAAGTIDQTKLNDGVKALGATYQLTQQSQQKLQTAVDKQTAGITNNLNSTSKFKDSLSKASTAISLAGPMVAGLIEQAAFGNKKRTEMSATERGVQSGLSTGLTAISTGAGIGAAFGPFGAGIGAAAGALVGLTSALNATTLSAEELADLNQEQVQKSQASISAASSYIEAQKSLTQMIASGASSSDIEIATKKLSDNFNQIKDVKLQEIFNATGGDVALMTKQLQDYTNQVTTESARQSGLYGTNLKSEERASALSIGLGKEGSKKFIESTRKALQEAQKASDVIDKNAGLVKGNTPFTKFLYSLGEVDRKIAKKPIFKNFAENIVPQNEPERESKIKALVENLLTNNFEEVLKILEKNIDTIDLSKYIQNNKKVATESMTTIFQRIDESLLKLSFDLSMSFEEMSSQQKIKNTMNEFASSFEEQITNFVISNLPDYKKFQFAQLSIKQKTQSALQKQQQEQSSLLLNQQKERSDLIQSNAKDLSSIFKQSMATSQENAKFFEQSILGKIKTANYKDIGIESIAQQIKESRVEQFRSILSAQGESLVGQTVLDLTNEADVENFRKNVVEKQKTAIKTAKAENLPETQIQSIADKFTNILTALNNALSATAFAASKNEKNAVQAALDEKARSIEKLDQQQQNAVKELQILQETNKLKLLAEEKFSTERSKVDQENLMRLKAVDSQIKRMGFAQTIGKAESEARVMDIQSTLNDPRNQLFLSLKEINENRIKAEREMIQERRAMEDEAMKNEQAQALLRLSAEIDNTTALENLNNTINDWLMSQSTEKIGGQAQLREMLNNPYVGMDANQINDYLQNRAADLGSNYNPSYEQQRIAEAQLYSPDKISALKMYKEASGNKTEIPKYSGMDFSKLEKATANDPVAAEQVKLLKEEYIAKAAAEQRLRAAQDRARQKDEENLRNQTSFSKRFEAGVGALKKESGVIVYDLTEKVPKMFADGLVDGIKAAIRQAENLGDVLMGIAASFLDEISTALMRSAVYGMLGSIGVPNLPKPAGSQRGGIIRAQNGVYVSGSGSGDKYPAMLENGEYVLNRNAVMAMGGPSELDKLNFSMAPRFATGGTFATELTDLKSMEEGMTTFGLENSKLYNELRDEEKAKQAEKRRKAFARKQMIAGLIASVASIVVSAGAMKIAGGIGDTGMGGTAASKGPGLDKPEALGFGISSSRDTSLAIGTGGQTGGSFTGKNFRKSNNSLSYGSRLSDTIPAYAEGGLHSLPIIRKYSAGMQGGGMYGGVSNNSNTVNNNNASNSFNFNTTVNRDGTIEMGANTTSYKQQDVELSNNLNSKIYGTVLDVIKQQQRFGGTLAGTRRPI